MTANDGPLMLVIFETHTSPLAFPYAIDIVSIIKQSHFYDRICLIASLAVKKIEGVRQASNEFLCS